MTSGGWTFATLLREHVAAHPDAPALVFRNRTTSYAALDRRSNQVANGLARLGVGRGGRVAVLDFNSDEYFEVFYGTAKRGGALVGINARLAAPEVEYILEDSTTEVLFVGEEHVSLVESLEARLKRLRAIVALSGTHPRWPAYRDWREAESAAARGFDVGEDDDFIQLYTSGTTGHPKGVCHTHAIWKRFSEACRAAEWGRYDSATVALVCMPVFHVAGFNCTNLTLLGGGCAVITRKVDPAEILDLLPRHRITDTLFVPAIILALTAHPRAAQTDFGALRTVSYGAAPIAPDLLDRARRLFGCGFVHLYGLTENLGGATYLPPEQHREDLGKLRSVGRPYEGLELRVVDESDCDVPRGQVGEIVLRCAWTMRGYWRNERATAEALRGGWLRTGDAGSLDQDGYLYILDRVKDMIITGGENVYPAEVEAALFGHPAIADVAVIGVPDERWGEAVKALVVVRPGATLDAEDLLRFARTRIAGYKVPKSVEAIAELPRNASGKVLRRVLREPYWRGRERKVH